MLKGHSIYFVLNFPKVWKKLKYQGYFFQILERYSGPQWTLFNSFQESNVGFCTIGLIV